MLSVNFHFVSSLLIFTRSVSILRTQFHSAYTVPFCIHCSILHTQFHSAYTVPLCIHRSFCIQFHSAYTVPFCIHSSILHTPFILHTQFHSTYTVPCFVHSSRVRCSDFVITCISITNTVLHVLLCCSSGTLPPKCVVTGRVYMFTMPYCFSGVCLSFFPPSDLSVCYALCAFLTSVSDYSYSSLCVSPAVFASQVSYLLWE